MAITSLHLVVPSRDGLVFIIEGSTGYVTEVSIYPNINIRTAKNLVVV